jgi:hypothetical protein
MHSEDEWERGGRGFKLGAAGFGALRLALLFGSAAVAVALIIAPIAERQSRPFQSRELDGMTTGSVRVRDSYTIRRSVLQPSPDLICVIRADGTRSGEC